MISASVMKGLKTVFDKFYLVHFGILCPIFSIFVSIFSIFVSIFRPRLIYVISIYFLFSDSLSSKLIISPV